VAPKTPPATPAVSGAEWLRAQDPRHFTLQLLAASNDRTVRDFIERHRLRAPHAVVKTMRNGSPLHVLAYESYSTRQAATTAAKKLPTGLRAWPRPFGELQGVPKAATPFAAAPSELKDGAWLWSRDPRRITVQLVGAESEQALLGHVGKEPLAGPLAMFTTDRGGKPWFVLVYGDFSDRDAALKARAALPARLRQGGPWLREFAAIHAILGPRSPSQP
jgi:septal ring-binding cell division protein DamX